MKIAIVGSRDFNDYETLRCFINETLELDLTQAELVISGGARGADTLAERYAKEYNIPLKVFPAEWERYGKAAGPIRNELIIQNCDVCFAFWDGESRGTKHDIDLCQQHNKKCYICRYN